MKEDQINDASLKGKVKCEAEIDRIQEQIYAHIHFSADTIQECARCLKNFVLQVEGDYRVTLQKSKNTASRENDTGDFYFNDEEDIVDTRSVLYEEIVTNIPIKPLCSKECPGITGKIAVKDFEEIDPRWSELKKLK